MAMTPNQQSEYNALLGKRNAYNQALGSMQSQLEDAKKRYEGATSPNQTYNADAARQAQIDMQVYQGQIDALKARGEGYSPWETDRMRQLEAGDQAAKSPLAAAMQGVPDLPKMDFSQLIRRRQVGTPEYAAQKAQMTMDAQKQQQLAQRQLAAQQAKMGVRGGAAGAQAGRLAEQTALQRAAAEQGLFAKNISEREKLEKGQQFGNLSSELARMQMASAELGQQRGLQAAADTAAAQRAAAAGAGGCCGAAIVATTILLESNQASASYLIHASKQNGVQMVFNSHSEKEFVRHLKGIRKIRDSWCSSKELRGYYWLSEKMAPTLSKSKPSCEFFFKAIVKPAVACAEGRAGLFDKLVVKTWIKFFGLFGSDKPFTRSNGEIV